MALLFNVVMCLRDAAEIVNSLHLDQTAPLTASLCVVIAMSIVHI